MTKKYPIDFNDQDLKNQITDYADHPVEQNNLSVAKYTKAIVGLIELQGRENKKIAYLTLATAIIALLISVYGVGLTHKQTNYTEIQSISERINQARITQEAILRCEQSPELEESGLFEISSGKSASCTQVLQLYKKDNPIWNKIKNIIHAPF